MEFGFGFATVALICLSAGFSAVETAFLSVKEARLHVLAESGNEVASIAEELKKALRRTTTTVLVANNAVNVALTMVSDKLFGLLFGNDFAAAAAAFATVAIVFWGEVTPKTIAMARAEQIALIAARPMELLVKALSPVCFLLEKWQDRIATETPDVMSSDEIAYEVEKSLDSDDAELVGDALDFVESPVSEAMVPRVAIATVDIHDSATVVAATFEKTKFSRLLVIDSDVDSVVGYVHVKGFFFRGDRDWRETVVQPLFFAPVVLLDEVLRSMRAHRKHLAVVVDDSTLRVQGIVTLEDILEEISGEIYDESDVVRQNSNRKSSVA